MNRADAVVLDCTLFTTIDVAQASGSPTAAPFPHHVHDLPGGPLVEMFAPRMAIANEHRAKLGLPAVERLGDIHDAAVRCGLFGAGQVHLFSFSVSFQPGLRWLVPIFKLRRSPMFPCERTASMARQVTLTLVDDIDGSQATETVSFGLDGRRYDIDLSTAHATQLRDALASYVAAARRGTGSTSRRRSPASSRPAGDREQTAAIRQWARANGQSVSDRGRISQAVLEAYGNRDQHPVPAETAAPARKSRKRSKKTAD